MPISTSHGRLNGSGNILWLKDRIAHLRREIMEENPVTINAFGWVNAAKVNLGTYTVRIAHVSRATVESNNETTDAHIPVTVLGDATLALETDHEFTSPSYPGLLFRIKKEVIDFNGGAMRRYEAEAIR